MSINSSDVIYFPCRSFSASQTENGGDRHVLPRGDIQPDGLWHSRLLARQRYGTAQKDMWCCLGDSRKCAQWFTLAVKRHRAVSLSGSLTLEQRPVQSENNGITALGNWPPEPNSAGFDLWLVNNLSLNSYSRSAHIR